MQGELVKLGHPIAASTMWQILHDAGIHPHPAGQARPDRAGARGILAVDLVHVDTVLLRRIHARHCHYTASQLLAGGIDLRNSATRLRHGSGGANHAQALRRPSLRGRPPRGCLPCQPHSTAGTELTHGSSGDMNAAFEQFIWLALREQLRQDAQAFPAADRGQSVHVDARHPRVQGLRQSPGIGIAA